LRRSPRRTWPTQWCTRPADHPTSRWEGNDEGSVALSPPLHLQEQSVSPKPLKVCVCVRACFPCLRSPTCTFSRRVKRTRFRAAFTDFRRQLRGCS
jgi:hypothetical protein